jgi:hypothetical protein
LSPQNALSRSRPPRRGSGTAQIASGCVNVSAMRQVIDGIGECDLQDEDAVRDFQP